MMWIPTILIIGSFWYFFVGKQKNRAVKKSMIFPCVFGTVIMIMNTLAYYYNW